MVFDQVFFYVLVYMNIQSFSTGKGGKKEKKEKGKKTLSSKNLYTTLTMLLQKQNYVFFWIIKLYNH